jgi:hypothetical protein
MGTNSSVGWGGGNLCSGSNDEAIGKEEATRDSVSRLFILPSESWVHFTRVKDEQVSGHCHGILSQLEQPLKKLVLQGLEGRLLALVGCNAIDVNRSATTAEAA